MKRLKILWLGKNEVAMVFQIPLSMKDKERIKQELLFGSHIHRNPGPRKKKETERVSPGGH